MEGPQRIALAPEFREFAGKDATHLVWATGGSMVPPEQLRQYYEAGKPER